MARIYAKRKGKSGSKRPQVKESPAWVPLKNDEIENLIVKLAGTGLTSSQIGLRLRDNYGVPDVRLATGKNILQIMKEKGVKFDLPEDVAALMKRAALLQAHLKSNPADLANKRALELVVSKVRRLSKYYKREGLMPQGWEYSTTPLETKAG